MENKKKYRIGIVPGSFDPITLGHVDIVRRASDMCDTVYVAVMINASKKYMFSIDERKAIAEAACAEIGNVKVISSEGMLFELAKELSAEAIIKGVRNEVDRAYELDMAKFNAEHYEGARTVLLDADPTLDTLSSTLVRQKIVNGESLEGYLPAGALSQINKILNK